MMAAYYELTLTSESKEDLEKIRYWIVRQPASIEIESLVERCEHGEETDDCDDCPPPKCNVCNYEIAYRPEDYPPDCGVTDGIQCNQCLQCLLFCDCKKEDVKCKE